MKVLILIYLSFVLSSCFSPQFKVGDCIQKPDESSVWKVESFKDGISQLSLFNNNDKKEATLPGGYIKTKCPY